MIQEKNRYLNEMEVNIYIYTHTKPQIYVINELLKKMVFKKCCLNFKVTL